MGREKVVEKTALPAKRLPNDMTRGCHSHLTVQELLIAVAGEFSVHCDNGIDRGTVTNVHARDVHARSPEFAKPLRDRLLLSQTGSVLCGCQ